MIPLKTDRLLLREWRESDKPAFARMNADLRVMEFFPAPLTRAESDQLFARIQSHLRQHGFGLYAAELLGTGSFLGFIGLATPSFQSTFTPCVEIGWRLTADSWGQGLATEGAREVARYAFDDLGLGELVSFTVAANARSRRVMEKLGMTHDAADDFEHPRLPEGHPLRRHVLYRLRRPDPRLLFQWILLNSMFACFTTGTSGSAPAQTLRSFSYHAFAATLSLAST